MPGPSQSAPSSQRLSRQSHSDALGRGLLIGGDEAQGALRLVQRSADRGPAMQEVLEQLVRLGRDSAPVWLYGEAGAGRHTAALALHALSAVAAGPVLVVHRSELQDVIALWREQDRGAGQLLGAILARAAGGTAIFDEGGAPDLDFQGLVSDLLGLSERRDGGGKDGASWPARLVLITAAQAAADLGMLAELLGRLGGRCVRVPPLRLRRGEIGALATELTARSRADDGEAATGLDFGAAALLTDQPLRGNVRQLALAAARLAARRPAGGELIAPDVAEILGLRAEPPADPLALRATGQALGEVLRLVLPLVPDGAEAEGEEPPWAPLLLRRDERDPVGIFRLRAGPAPLDEAVVGAGLRPRPRGPIGAGGGGGAASGIRTGDEPSLSRLGPPWRGNLLGLLRALHRDLGAGELSLLDLGLALLLSGPPLPPQKLLRLVLRQPLDLTPEETAALLDRLELLQGGAPAQGRGAEGALRCEDPALGRSWADAMRGLVPRATQEALFRHARGCALCGEALWMSWRLPDLSGAGETLPLPVYADGSPAPEVEPQVEPTTAARAAAISGAPAPAPTPAALEPAAAPASSAEAAPAASAQSPVAVPPTMAALRPGHWVALSLLLALALVAGTLFGQLLVKRGIHLF